MPLRLGKIWSRCGFCGRIFGRSRRRIAAIIVVIGALGTATQGLAQSAALKEAWEKTNTLYSAGKYAEAETWAKQAVDLAQQEFGVEQLSYSTSLSNLAAVYQQEGRYAEAEPLFKRALAIDQKALSADDPGIATDLDNLAALYDSQGRYAEAEPLYQRALAINERALGADDPAVATSLNNLAVLYWDEGRYAEAEPLYRRALAIHEKTLGPDHPDVATDLNNLASLYNAQGRYAEAEPLSKRALAIRQKSLGPDHPDVASSLNNLALLYEIQGRYTEAEPLFQRALAIYEKALGPNHPDVAMALNNLAELYQTQGRYAEAEPLFQRALANVEKALGPDHPDVAACLNNLAMLYKTQGRYADAEPLYQRALAIHEKALGPDHPDVAISLSNLAALYDSEERYSDAEPLDTRALAIKEKAFGPAHPDIAISLINLASVYEHESRYAEAEPLYKRAVAIDEQMLGPDNRMVAIALNNLALLYKKQGRDAEAEPLFKRALAVDEKALDPDHPSVANTLGNLAALYVGQGRYPEALPFARRAVAIEAGRASSRNAQSKSQLSELRGARAVFLDDLAITAHLSMVDSADAPQLRDEGFAALQWSKASDTAAAVAHVAARFAAGSDALTLVVRARQDAQDQLDAIDAALLRAVSKPPAQRDPATEDRLHRQRESLRQELTRRDAELAATFPAYAELANPQPLKVADTQNELAVDQALLVFAVADGQTYIAVVTRSGYGLHIAPFAAKDLAAAVKTLRSSLDAEGVSEAPPFEASTAYRLYQQLLAWAEADLKGVRQLYVVTDGALESLPLGVLLTEPPAADTLSETEALRAAPWLAKGYAVSVLPSVSSLKALRQFANNSRAAQPFLGIGDPLLKDHPPAGEAGHGAAALAPAISVAAAFRGGSIDIAGLRDLPSLPETAGELAAEATLFKADADALLLRAAATVTAVKHADLASRRIIAFATHGLVAGDVGVAEPGLVLTPPADPSAEDDGLLKASEIAQLKLNADLVILSACNTAASDGTPGAEGFSGLSKAFLYAGARALLVSHWSVVSGSTVALMTRLAVHLDEEGVGRAEALRRAEIDLMNDPAQPLYAHPMFWAPFVVVGEGA
jgi:tetratricopeptide (TPR) repeat protein